MAKKNNWYSEPLKINFNYKEWRQDFAAFIRKKLFWDFAIVSKSKAVDRNSIYKSKGNKVFEIYDGRGRYLKVIFKNKNEIVSIEPKDFKIELIFEYFEKRNII